MPKKAQKQPEIQKYEIQIKNLKDDLAYKDRIDLASSGDMFELEDSEDDSFDNSDY